MSSIKPGSTVIPFRKARPNITGLLESLYYYILVYKRVDRGCAVKNRYYINYLKPSYIISYKVRFRPPLY